MRNWVMACVAIGLLSSVALADPRPFTFTYDTYSEGKGNWEYEQWVTWSRQRGSGADRDRVSFRHELEVGLADNFDLAVYFPEWHTERELGDTSTRFDGGAIEAIFYLSNPVTDPIGSALYAEAKFGPDEYAFEAKLLLQKDIGKWIFAYNFVVETEIEQEDGENELVGVIGQNLGVSYALTPSWSAGAEVQAEWEFEDWSRHIETTVYAGPVISYQSGHRWWITATAMFELTGESDAADFMGRVIVGFEF